MTTFPSCHSGYRYWDGRPKWVLAQRLEEEQRRRLGEERTPIPANPQVGVRFRRRQSYQNVSRETFWYDWAEKFCLAKDSGAVLGGSDQSIFGAIGEKRRQCTDFAGLVIGMRPRCKIGTTHTWKGARRRTSSVANV